VKNTLDKVLEKLGRRTDSSRSYIFEIDQKKQTMSNTYEWVNSCELKSSENPDGIEAQIKNLQDIPIELFPDWMSRMKRNEVINAPNIYKYGFEKSVVETLDEQDIKSILIIPLYYGGKLHGFIGFDECKRYRTWDEATVEFLRTNSINIASFIEGKKTEKEKEKLLHDLGKRIKELKGLYGLAKLREQPDITLEEIFQGAVNLIPPAWQYPEITCARIQFEDKEFKTDNFRKTKWRQSVDIKVNRKKVGIMEVYYIEKKPEIYEGPFLKEERDLIDAFSERLGRTIERKKAEEELRQIKAAVEDSSDAILITNQIGKVIFMNQAFGYLFGWTPAMKHEVDIYSIPVDPDDINSILENLKEKSNWEGEIQVNGKNVQFLCYLRCSEILDEQFNPIGILWVFTDIEAKLKQ